MQSATTSADTNNDVIEEESKDVDVSSATSAEIMIELPTLISGKVIEMSGGGMNAHGHAADCDFLGHLPPAASYQLVELDLKTSQPACSNQAL